MALNLKNPTGYSGTPATQQREGVVRLATNAEVIAGVQNNVAVSPASLQANVDNGITSTGDITARTFFASGDEGTGVASQTALTNVVDTTQGAGALSIVSTTANNGDNAGFLKMYVGTTAVWVPYFTDIAP